MSNVILYSIVARGSVILAECSNIQGNASMVALQLLEKIQASNSGDRCSYILDNHAFHILKSGGDLIFLCMCEQSIGRRIAFSFLDDIQSRFNELHGPTTTNNCATASAYEFNSTFAPILKDRAIYHSDPRNDSVSRVRGEVESLRGIMVENISNVLERGDRLELLVQKTDDFAENSFVFKRSAIHLQRQMWWKNTRTMALGAGLVLLLLYILASLVCSPTLHC